MVVLGRCCVRDPVRAVPYANQVFIERACRTCWACGEDAGECGGGNLMRFHVNILSNIIIDNHNRRYAPLTRESRPKASGNEPSVAQKSILIHRERDKALFSFWFPFCLCRRLILVHFKSLPQSYAGFAAGPSRRKSSQQR
jgi:hypothetical protein